MHVPADVVRAVLKTELAAMESMARVSGWIVEARLDELLVRVTMAAHTGEQYFLVAEFDGYKALPPALDFANQEFKEIGAARFYPKATDSLFHTAPCICAPFNRKAYRQYAVNGPHSDWPIDQWAANKANGTNWSNLSTFGDMLGAIYLRLQKPRYVGRIG